MGLSEATATAAHSMLADSAADAVTDDSSAAASASDGSKCVLAAHDYRRWRASDDVATLSLRPLRVFVTGGGAALRGLACRLRTDLRAALPAATAFHVDVVWIFPFLATFNTLLH